MQLRSDVVMALVKAGGYNSDRPLPWEPPYAAGTTLEKAQKTKKQKNKKRSWLYFFTLTMKYQKGNVNKQSLLKWHPKN